MDEHANAAPLVTTNVTTSYVALEARDKLVSNDATPFVVFDISDDGMEFVGHDGHEHSRHDPVDIDHATEDVMPDSLVSSDIALEEIKHFNDEENNLLHHDFNATCRLTARLGAAAMNCGSIADNIERFLPELMKSYGYYGFFTCSTQEICCNFETRDPNDTIVRTQNVAIKAGSFQLTKLAWLSDLAKDLLERNIDIQEANQRLDEILASPDPWGTIPLALAFMITGAALPVLLSSTWWNVLVGILAGGIGYSMILFFDSWPDRVHVWLFLTSSFLCSALGSFLQLVRPEIDPTLVTLSGVVVLLPSATITLGINDLVSNHVLSGFERLVKGLIIMTWIALGYVVGMSSVDFLAVQWGFTVPVETVEVAPISAWWQILFLPCIAGSLTIIFQMTGKDALGAILCIMMGYLASFLGFLLLDKPYLPSLLGSLTIALYANIWSRFYDRPNTIILFPAFQLVVAGIVGFMGLTEIIQGNTEEGGAQVLHMLIVAAIVVLGFLVGGALVQPYTTI